MNNEPPKVSNTVLPVLYSAPWIIPIAQEPIYQGAIVVAGDTIQEVGKRAELLEKYTAIDHVEYTGIFMPPLVNAHIHLELSHLADVQRPGPHEKMTSWIEELLSLRINEDEKEVERCMQGTTEQLYRSGCILLLDIGNRQDRKIDTAQSGIEVLSLLECLGPTQTAIDNCMATLARLDEKIGVTGHAPYSTSGPLLQHLKQTSLSTNSIFSIHVAETEDEREFLSSGTGCFRDFLERRQAWDGSFPFDKEGVEGTVLYLDGLGVLDRSTLCVHCVHLTEVEIKLLAARETSVCLCPGSNSYLRAGKAPLELMLKHKLLPALGTDSLASNEVIDLWWEMQLLSSDHPTVKPAVILKMATLGGAKALHRNDDYGTLEPGKRARFIHIDDKRFADNIEWQEMIHRLVCLGRPEMIEWIDSRRKK